MDKPDAFGGSDEGPSPTGYLFASLAGCTTVIIERIATDLGIQADGIKVRSEAFYSPWGIADQDGYESAPTEVRSDITLKTSASDTEINNLQKAYFKHCPIYNLFRKSGTKVVDNWVIKR